MSPRGATAVLAVDDGPRASCRPLLALGGSVALDDAAQGAQIPKHWAAEYRRTGTRTLICGTSDSVEGRAIESAARRAARAGGLRVVALEDFPGNYWDLEGGAADIVVVESEAAANLARARLGIRCPELWISPSPRYDASRRRLAESRRRYAQRDRTQRLVLWAGQPETDDAVATLRRALPALQQSGAALLFRAHPRDPGRARGEYRWLLDDGAIPARDVTGLPLGECLALAPELVLTQYSSVGVEAGFHGIPTVHALYPDVGGKSLRRKKGYSALPWCADGAAILLELPGGEAELLRTALWDDEARARVIASFDEYFRAQAEALPALGTRLYNHGLIESTAPHGRASG